MSVGHLLTFEVILSYVLIDLTSLSFNIIFISKHDSYIILFLIVIILILKLNRVLYKGYIMKIKFLLLLLFISVLSLNSQAQMRDYVVKGGLQIDERLIFAEFNEYKFSFLVRGYLNLRFNTLLSGEFGIGLGHLSGTDAMHNKFPDEWKTNITTIDARLRIAPFTKIPYLNPYL